MGVYFIKINTIKNFFLDYCHLFQSVILSYLKSAKNKKPCNGADQRKKQGGIYITCVCVRLRVYVRARVRARPCVCAPPRACVCACARS